MKQIQFCALQIHLTRALISSFDAEVMADLQADEAPSAEPVKLVYDPITGVPSEYNQYLPKDCEEYKR